MPVSQSGVSHTLKFTKSASYLLRLKPDSQMCIRAFVNLSVCDNL